MTAASKARLSHDDDYTLEKKKKHYNICEKKHNRQEYNPMGGAADYPLSVSPLNLTRAQIW